MRNFLHTHHLAAANTHFSRGCGATFHGPLGHPSRIDYVVVPQGLLQHITDVRVWYRSGYRLQLIDSPELRDHCPIVVWTSTTSCPSRSRSVTPGGISRNSDVQLTDTQARKFFCEKCKTSLAALPPPSDDVCVSWNALNNIVCRLARRFFTQSGSRRAQRPPDTQQAAEQAMLARKDYRDACRQLRRQQQPAQSVHLAWAAWQKYMHFKALQRHSKQLCRRDRRHKVDDLVQQLQQAVRDKNASLQWKLAYQIAGGKHGPKKRRYDHPQRFRATAQEWVHELSLAGPQGGCAATRLDKASADAIFRLYSQGANCFQKTQCRRTLFQRRTFCSMMGPVVGHGGHNRLVLACTCTFGSLQRRTWGSCAKPCEHYDAKELFLTGEQAITQQRCINWRLQHAGLGHVTVLYDVKNAFPSPSHDSLDAAVRQHARS